ncbi:MAG TPA: TetR/AcrR family transcriptional regulator [Candidatus Limnocylindrales bacterium]|nr:TetR/AcrR family transcriptional regulator [Candidatus Limnocylindrales bacterium]
MQSSVAALSSRGSSPGKREATKARNRSVILTSAREVFATLGFDAATVRDIVRGTDLAVGTFYQYFRDKNDVFAAVAEETLRELRARLRRYRTDASVTFDERIYNAYFAFFDMVVHERRLFEVLDRNIAPLVSDISFESTRVALAELREDLQPLLEAEQVAPVDADYVAAASIGVGMMVARQLLERAQPDAVEAARFCTTLLLQGLRGRAQDHRGGGRS